MFKKLALTAVFILTLLALFSGDTLPTPAPSPLYTPTPEATHMPWLPLDYYDKELLRIPMVTNNCTVGGTVIVYGSVDGIEGNYWVMRLGKYMSGDYSEMFFWYSPELSPASRLIDDEYKFSNVHCGKYVLLAYHEMDAKYYILEDPIACPFMAGGKTELNADWEDFIYINDAE